MARPPSEDAGNRVPPHDLAAEDGVLMAALVSREAADAARAVIGDAGEFYRPSNAHIWSAIVAVQNRGEVADLITVAGELRRVDLLEEVGGSAHLLELAADTTGSLGNTVSYARAVRDAAIARHVIAEATAIVNDGYAGPADIAAYVGRSQERLLNLNGHTPAELGHNLRIANVAELIAGGVPRVDPDFWTRTDGAALLYAGKMHMFQAEPSAGKSFLALHAAAEVLSFGGAVLYIDFEDTDAGIVGRLLAVGASGPAVADRFGYVAQDGPFGHAEQRALAGELERLNPDLIVIDGVAEALVRDGLDENSAAEFVQWVERLPRPLARTGSAVLMLDHVKKDAPGRWARGTGAKLGALDGVAYTVKVETGFSRQSAGRVKLIVAKDRPGGVGAPGEVVADITITPQAAGEHVAIVIDPHRVPTDSDGAFTPTRAMEQVSRVLERDGSSPPSAVVDSIGNRFARKIVLQAIARLVTIGHVRRTGSVSSGVLSLVKPYRDPEPHLTVVPDPEPDPDPPGMF